MERDTKIIIGLVLVGGAIAAGAYAYEEFTKNRIAISISPGTVPYGDNQQVAVTLSWTNGKTYAVQGAIIGAYSTDANLVDGHFWNSPSLAQQAGSLYASGQISQANAMAQNPQDRIAIGTGSARLYAYGRMAQGEVWAFWVSEAANQNSLIVQDPIGTNISALQNPKPTTHRI